MIIHCMKLTTCDSIRNGEIIKLEFIDDEGRPISLRFAFEHAQSIALTLPRLLSEAVRAQSGLDSARYVFPLDEWIVEGVEDHHSLILTLKTEDGFEVSFRIPPDACRGLGRTLEREADHRAHGDCLGDTPAGSGNPELH